MLQILQKTSRKIGKPFHVALKRDEVNRDDMAEDLKTTKQTISHHATDFDCPPDMAVKYSEYLHDPKFNQQMAAIYFDAISMFNPNQWAKQFQNAPYATWVQLRHVEEKRLKMGSEVMDFACDGTNTWTDEQRKMAHDWMIDLLKTISLSSLMAYQFSEVANLDLVNMSKSFNKQFGDLK